MLIDSLEECLFSCKCNSQQNASEFGAVKKYTNLEDLEKIKYCKISVYLQKSASVQPRTSLPKLHSDLSSTPVFGMHIPYMRLKELGPKADELAGTCSQVPTARSLQ